VREPARILLACLIPLLCGAPAPAQEGVLDARIQEEARILDQEIDVYMAARDAERRALEAYRKSAVRLDEAMQARQSLEEVRALLDEVDGGRQGLAAAMGNAALSRHRLVERAARIRAILDEQEEAAPATAGGSGPLDGVWRLGVKGQEDAGTIELRQDGTLVTGRYLLENGSQGSVRGTFVADVLRIESIHSTRGLTYTLEGILDPGTGELRGTFLAVVLNSPDRASGEWTARKVSWAGGR